MRSTGMQRVSSWAARWAAVLLCLVAPQAVAEVSGQVKSAVPELTVSVTGPEAQGHSLALAHFPEESSRADLVAAGVVPDSLDRAPSARRESPKEYSRSERIPVYLTDEALLAIWREGIEFERRENFLGSAARYEVIASKLPDQSHTYWRIARNYWRHGEGMPRQASNARLHYFELAEEWSARGLEVDDECGACMLWKFVSMGRQATTRGLLSAVPDAREMDRLLRRGIELKPPHRDNAANSTLGNLYYAASVFYRILPDWWWLRVVVGVRGDKERSLRYARRAVETAGVRVDYRIELGASLLCLGLKKEREDRIAEGVGVLRESLELDSYLSTDRLDRKHALILLESPELACGYSRDGFIDVDALREQAEARR